MLAHLTISDFAIIDHLEVDFRPGLNILSGETGAGKSIIINAVNLILGGRASSDLIRTGADQAVVEALFTLPNNTFWTEYLSGMGYAFEEELLIKRILTREGPNRIIINGSMATLQTLSRLGMMIISISGQHEHQLLLRPDNHLSLLDNFGDLTDERMRLSEAFRAYETQKEELHALEKEIKEDRERQELYMFQLHEIEAAGIAEEEDRSLEDEKKRLRHAGQLKEILSESYQKLYEKEDSVISDIASCIKGMEKGTEIDPRLVSVKRILESAGAELEEAGLQLRDLLNDAISDPRRLDEVEERLHFLNRLKKKYGPTLKDILSFKEKLSGMMANLDTREKALEEMKKELKKRERDTLTRAVELSKKRRVAAERLQSAVEREIHLLEMGGTRFRVDFEQAYAADEDDGERLLKHIRPDGLDRVEFLLSPNMGEDLKPLSKIASGGELSRIMLALKSLLAKRASVETIIFDEVDSGIGGATAEVVGEKLQSLAEYHQIICITHLPQIASKGAVHFLVKKVTGHNRVQTAISMLAPEERINEIARLLGGKIISERAMAHAREMLG